MTTLSRNASGEVQLVLRGEAENRILATLRHWPYWLRVNIERDPEDSARCLSVTLIADQVAVNYRKADITERQKAMLDFAVKVSRSAETVGEADFDVLKSHGFDEEDIWDIAAIAAFFALWNRMANVTAMRPNAEFYTMGRS